MLTCFIDESTKSLQVVQSIIYVLDGHRTQYIVKYCTKKRVLTNIKIISCAEDCICGGIGLDVSYCRCISIIFFQRCSSLYQYPMVNQLVETQAALDRHNSVKRTKGAAKTRVRDVISFWVNFWTNHPEYLRIRKTSKKSPVKLLANSKKVWQSKTTIVISSSDRWW